jgi:hypothetical protein
MIVSLPGYIKIRTPVMEKRHDGPSNAPILPVVAPGSTASQGALLCPETFGEPNDGIITSYDVGATFSSSSSDLTMTDTTPPLLSTVGSL